MEHIRTRLSVLQVERRMARQRHIRRVALSGNEEDYCADVWGRRRLMALCSRSHPPWGLAVRNGEMSFEFRNHATLPFEWSWLTNFSRDHKTRHSSTVLGF